MRFLVDECLGHRLVSELRDLGHDVVWVRETAKGTPDEEILAWSVREKRILLTEDFDYGDLIFAKGHHAFGVVIVQSSIIAESWNEVVSRVTTRLDELRSGLPGNLTVIGRTRVKPRALPSTKTFGV